jgi:23S rRNA (pseudouridine1915-N3)-methyltransferase
MRLIVAAVGRLKQGPERDLVGRYGDRAAKAGRPLGCRTLEIVELDESRARDARERKADEGTRLAAAVPEGAALIVLDESGEQLSSEALAGRIARWRDEGRDIAFVLGGPDGLDGKVRDKADTVLAFGRATWPHQLARIMLLEQIYRAVTILSGHPYHRN